MLKEELHSLGKVVTGEKMYSTGLGIENSKNFLASCFIISYNRKVMGEVQRTLSGDVLTLDLDIVFCLSVFQWVVIIIILFSLYLNYHRRMLKYFTFECRGNLSSSNIVSVEIVKDNFDISSFQAMNIKVTNVILSYKAKMTQNQFVGICCNLVSNKYNVGGRVVQEKPFLAAGTAKKGDNVIVNLIKNTDTEWQSFQTTDNQVRFEFLTLEKRERFTKNMDVYIQFVIQCA